MKIRTIIIFLFVSLVINAQSKPDSLYMAANEAYSNGSYEEALGLYETILKVGLESADLYYNLGNASFRSNRLGYAVLYYEKALKLDPGHENATKNLTYVSSYKEDELESVPELFLKRWINALFEGLSVNSWSVLSLVVFILLLTGILVYIFAAYLGMKKAGFYSALVGLLVFAVSFTGAVKQHRSMTQFEHAVIIDPSVVVKSSPSLSGTDLFVLHEGTTVEIDDEVGEWIEIKISDGRVGWITKNAMEVF